MMCKYLLTSVILFCFCCNAVAQNEIVINQLYTAQQLAETIMDNNCEVEISNAVITGYNGPEGKSYGYYSLNPALFGADWPLLNGVLLSSGHNLTQGYTPLTWEMQDPPSSGTTAWGGDTDISNAIGGTATYNATVLEFDFVPSVSHVSFIFMMSSYEFNSIWFDPERDCSYNDGVAILIKPANGAQPYQNLALLPVSNIPVCNSLINASSNCWEQNFWNEVALYNLSYTLVAGTDVIPGTTYHIKLGVVDGIDAGFDSSLLIASVNPDYSINLGIDRMHQFYDPLCDGEVLTVESKPGAVQYKWYKDDALIAGQQDAFYTITQPGTYTSVATMPNGCDYTGNIIIEYNAPISQQAVTYYQCDEDGDGFTAYYIPQVGQEVLPDGVQPIFYYHNLSDANNNTNPINILPTPELYYNITPDEKIYARVQNQYGCQQIIPIILSITPPLNPVFQPITGCPDSGGEVYFDLGQSAIDIAQGYPAGTSAQFFLSVEDALLGLSALPTLYNGSQTGGMLYVKLIYSQGCYGIGTIQLQVQDFGQDFEDELVALCELEPLTLDAGNGFVSYTWDTTPVQYTQAIQVSGAGNYTVKVTNAAGCIQQKTFTVFHSQPPQDITYQINDFSGGNNSVLVIAEGTGLYEYSLDGINYFPEGAFNGLEPGRYTIFVRDANGCQPVFSEGFYILDYPAFFTPDGDGINDTWRIPFMQFRPGLVVSVFDRFGRVITSFSGISPGWDGTLNGKPLPATDYWFSIKPDAGREIKGHFSLVR